MLKSLFLAIFACLFCQFAAHAQEVTGYWKTIDDESGKPKSIVLIYPYQGKIWGRIVAIYDEKGNFLDNINHPEKKAELVKGSPYFSGLDIIWNLEKTDGKYGNGKILDPNKGKIYDAEIWTANGKLMVRGKILMFGRNQTWLPVTDTDLPSGFQKPDPSKFEPKIPEVAPKQST